MHDPHSAGALDDEHSKKQTKIYKYIYIYILASYNYQAYQKNWLPPGNEKENEKINKNEKQLLIF